MEQIRKQVYISSVLDRVLKQVCSGDSVSESEVIRRALEAYFRWRGIEAEEDPILRTIGLAGDEGPGTGSTQHDDIYDHVK